MPYYSDDPTGLVGEQLNAVAFVMNYVEFHFNGPILRALTGPLIEFQGAESRFPEPGSRDALCALIGTEVERVDVREADRIELRTSAGHRLVIPLDEASRKGAEAAQYVPADQQGRLRVADMLIW